MTVNRLKYFAYLNPCKSKSERHICPRQGQNFFAPHIPFCFGSIFSPQNDRDGAHCCLAGDLEVLHPDLISAPIGPGPSGTSQVVRCVMSDRISNVAVRPADPIMCRSTAI